MSKKNNSLLNSQLLNVWEFLTPWLRYFSLKFLLCTLFNLWTDFVNKKKTSMSANIRKKLFLIKLSMAQVIKGNIRLLLCFAELACFFYFYCQTFYIISSLTYVLINKFCPCSYSFILILFLFYSIELKGMHLNHNFHVVVGKQWIYRKCVDRSPTQYLYINQQMFFHSNLILNYYV